MICVLDTNTAVRAKVHNDVVIPHTGALKVCKALKKRATKKCFIVSINRL